MKHFVPHSLKISALSLLLSTAMSVTAIAATPLHELSPSQIALDVERRINPETNRFEYIAKDFDPFEGDNNVAGSAALRSAHDGLTISGKSIYGGAFLDISTVYLTGSADPYDIRGYDYAVYLSGEPVEFMRYDSRVLECYSENRSLAYDDGYYTGARYGFLAGIYRPYPIYRGHRHYRDYGLGYWGYHPYRDRSYAHYRYNYDRYRSRDGDRYRYYRDRNRRDRDGTRDRDRDYRDGGSDGRVRNNTVTTAVPRVEGRRQNQHVLTNPGRDPAAFRANPFQERLTNGNEGRARRAVEQSRTRAETTSRTRDLPRITRGTPPVKRHIQRSEPIKRSFQREDRAVRTFTPPQREIRSVTPPKRQVQSYTPPKRAVQTPQPVKRVTPPKRENRPVKRARQDSRPIKQAPRRSNRAVDRAFKSSNPSLNGRVRNFYPVAAGYSYANGYRDSNCTKEERLSLHIPQERLLAARYDGLTVILLDRQGGEVPVYIPPNYISGFLKARGFR